MVAPSRGSAAQFALWLDGNTTPDGGGNGIPFSLTAAFGASSFTLITNAQLDTPGFLSGFDAVIISRFGFGPDGAEHGIGHKHSKLCREGSEPGRSRDLHQ
jgi:hypothetical protein